jgi:hypothetical protein
MIESRESSGGFGSDVKIFLPVQVVSRRNCEEGSKKSENGKNGKKVFFAVFAIFAFFASS